MILRKEQGADARTEAPVPVELHVVKNRMDPCTGDSPIRLVFDGAHNSIDAA